MERFSDLHIPLYPQLEHRIFFGNIFIGIFKRAVSLFWGDGSSTAREVSDLTEEQRLSLLSTKDLWIIFDGKNKVIGISIKI